MARQAQRIKALEAEVKRLRPNKRKKVVPDPNERFVAIWQVGQVQAEVAEALEAEEESKEADNEEEVRDCIWVKN